MNTLLVTAYTPGYADLADRLIRSIEGMGCQIHLVRYESSGSWERNGHVKPYAMLEAMRREPLRPVCWVDSDALVRSPPTLLDELSAGVAFHTVPKTGETLSGTVWTRSMTFLLAWISALERNPATWDQRVLDEAVKSAGVSYEALPAEYCWVDFMAEPRWGGPRVPVIEHTQASRDVRAGKRAM